MSVVLEKPSDIFVLIDGYEIRILSNDVMLCMTSEGLADVISVNDRDQFVHDHVEIGFWKRLCSR